MSYEVSFKEYAEALYESLQEDTYFIAIEESIADKENAKEIMIKYYDFSILESQKYGEVFMPTQHKFGVSLWSKPISDEMKNQKNKERKEFIIKELGEDSLKVYNCITDFMSKKSDELIDSKAWYLSIIGVLPAFQGQGLGKDLINPIVVDTDKLGVATFIETFTPRNKTFYARLGFADLGVFIEPVTKLEYSIMCREAKASK